MKKLPLKIQKKSMLKHFSVKNTKNLALNFFKNLCNKIQKMCVKNTQKLC